MIRIIVTFLASFYSSYHCFASDFTRIEFNESSQSMPASLDTKEYLLADETDPMPSELPPIEDKELFLQKKIFELTKNKKSLEEELQHFKGRVNETEERLAEANYDLTQEKEQKFRISTSRAELEKELDSLKQYLIALDAPRLLLENDKLKMRVEELVKSLVDNLRQNKQLLKSLELRESDCSRVTDRNKLLNEKLIRIQAANFKKIQFIKSAISRYEEMQKYCLLLEDSRSALKSQTEQTENAHLEKISILEDLLDQEKQKVMIERNKLMYALELHQLTSAKSDQQAELEKCRQELNDLREWKQAVTNNPCIIPGRFCFETRLEDGTPAHLEMSTQEMYFAFLGNKTLQTILEEKTQTENASTLE